MLKSTILSSYFRDGLQEDIVKFEVSAASQAVLFEAAVAVELSACSAANDKFRYRLVSLDLPARLNRRVVSFASRQKKRNTN